MAIVSGTDDKYYGWWLEPTFAYWVLITLFLLYRGRRTKKCAYVFSGGIAKCLLCTQLTKVEGSLQVMVAA